MNKLKVFVAFGALCLLMSSCVYSLFPIYTPDTLVFLPELIGRWQTEANGDYIEFTALNANKVENIQVKKSDVAFTMNDDSDGDPETYSYEIKGDGWIARSDNPIEIEVNGVMIDDQEKVKAYYDSLFGSVSSDANKALGGMVNKLDSAVNSEGNELGDMVRNLSKGVGKLGKALKQLDAKVKGSAYTVKEESYKMVVMTESEKTVFLVHVVEIGEDYYLDLYPLNDNDGSFGDGSFPTSDNNLFPVHTFMKMNLEDGQLKLNPFDLEKLNELFESNLVRLRHEYVEGNVVITAQPKEIQKFLDKYSNDESVFEGEEVYTRVAL